MEHRTDAEYKDSGLLEKCGEGVCRPDRTPREAPCRLQRGAALPGTSSTVVRMVYLSASGEGDVVGQAPGVMYSK
jgi:hypothetical protein